MGDEAHRTKSTILCVEGACGILCSTLPLLVFKIVSREAKHVGGGMLYIYTTPSHF